MVYLRQQGAYQNCRLPDLMLLDLNMPRNDGREVLKEVRSHERLTHIPIVVLTTSKAEQDVLTAYGLHANAYLKKPIDLQHFKESMHSFDQFFLTCVVLPTVE